MRGQAKALTTAVAVSFAAFGVAEPTEAAFVCNKTQSTTNSPYSQAKFQSVLQRSKLQLPTSSTCISNSDIENYYYDPDNWYLDNTNMQFEIDNGADSARNELRGDSFAGTRTGMEYTSRLKVQYGGSFSDGFTVAQIYGETGGKPILRIEFIASRSGLSNRLWGIYRTDASSTANFEYQDLGPAPTAFTELKLVYNDAGTVTAKLGTNPKRSWSTNFSYYNVSSKLTYFKTGCYLQEPGDCWVRISSLQFET